MRIVGELRNTRSWHNRYTVEGDSGKKYVVSQDKHNYWHCVCPHWTMRLSQYLGRTCKHIDFLLEELVASGRLPAQAAYTLAGSLAAQEARPRPEAKNRISEANARAAYATLVAYGQAAHTSPVSEGEALGYACFSLGVASDPAATIEKSCKVVTDAAMEMLTQWNGHLSVAAIDAIENGKGKVTRDGRFLSIILPEHWG